jgi:hypothetical protein
MTDTPGPRSTAPPKPRSFEGLKSASDVAKQVITLSTGVIAVTVAFFTNIQGATSNDLVHGLIVASWVAFIAAIAFAVWTLLGVTTSLNRLDRIENGEVKPLKTAKGKQAAGEMPAWSSTTPGAYDPMVRGPAAIMLLLFFAALVLTALAGGVRSSAPAPPPVRNIIIGLTDHRPGHSLRPDAFG